MTFRNVLVVALCVAAVSCQSQPKPYCPVAVGSPLGFPSPGSPLAFSYAQFALPNFWAQYKLKSPPGGACSQLPGEEIGFQRFEVVNKPTDITIAIRPFTPTYMRGNIDTYGSLDWADHDISNDDVDPDAGTVIAAYPDPVLRTDPSDPDGEHLNGVDAKLAPDPDEDDACLATGFKPIDVNFQEEVLPLVPGGGASARGIIDGGTVTYPAVHLRYEWETVRILSTTEIPGTIFTAQLKYTEDTCSATYDVTGIWPITLCHTDLDCSPYPVGDGPADSELGIPSRRFQGSGLNPAYDAADAGFPLRCNNSPAVHAYTASYAGPPHSASEPRILTDFNGDPVYGIEQWGVCEMTRPVTDFTMRQ